MAIEPSIGPLAASHSHCLVFWEECGAPSFAGVPSTVVASLVVINAHGSTDAAALAGFAADPVGELGVLAHPASVTRAMTVMSAGLNVMPAKVGARTG